MNGDRTVKISLLANVNGFVGQMARAQRSVKDFNTTLQSEAAANRERFNDISHSLVFLGIAIGGVAAIAVKKFADFDQAMDNVEAVTRESAGNMDLLREAALKAGAETVFTANEAADAIQELAKAGVSTADILGGGLTGALNLAAASGLSVARAAEIAAGALGMFKLEGADLAHVADILTAGAAKSIGEVDDLAWALRQAGPVASSMGLSIDETVGALSAFASTGRIGLDAGTSFKRMLQLLTPQSAAAAAKMEELGISGYNASGEFIGLTNFADNLQDSLKNLSTEQRLAALSTIFGSDAIAAASEVYKQGGEGIQMWIDKVNDQGYASENASIRLGNLKGDLEQLGGSLDTVFVTMGEGANGPLRALTQGVTDLVNGFGETGDGFQQAIFWSIALAGGLALLSGAFFIGITRLAAYKAAVDALAVSMPKLASGMNLVKRAGGWVGLALTALAGIVTAVEAYQDSLRLSAAEMTNMAKVTVDGAEMIGNVFQHMEFDNPEINDQIQSWGVGLWGAADAANNFDKVLGQISAQESVAGQFQWNFDDADKSLLTIGKTGGALGEAAGRIKEFGSSLADLSSTDLPAAQRSFKAWFDQTDGSVKQFDQLLDLMPAYKDQLVDTATTMGLDFTDAQVRMDLAMGRGQTGADAQRIKLQELGGAAQDTSGDIQALADEIRGFGSAELNTRDATRDMNQAFLDLGGEIEKITNPDNGLSMADMFDMSTQTGIDFTAAMDEAATSINETAAATWEQTGSVEAVNAVLDTERQRLVDMLTPFFESEAAAQAYVDTLVSTPEDITTNVVLNGLQSAQAALDGFIAGNYGREIYIQYRSSTLPEPGVVPMGRAATGGTIRGPGTTTSDDVPMWLSTGEEVIRAAMAAKYRPLLKAINEDQLQQYLKTQMGTLATGGSIGTKGKMVGAGMRSMPPSSAVAKAPVIQRVEETIILTLDGRQVAASVREYDRSLK